MGKGRVRVKGTKGRRWRKGQSSLSNPSEASHRLAARGKFGDHLSRGKSSVGLTTEKLAQLQEDREGDVELESRESGSVASSSALTLIETAHPVFGSVRKLWNSPTESHRVICAVLAAVAEVVGTHSSQNTTVEYFGALMSVLESCEDEKSVAAICYLLCVLMPSLPCEVLQVKYSTTCKILTDQLARHEASSSTALLKSLVKALAMLLGAQPAAVWCGSHCQKVFQSLLNFTIHPKPKLRKAAQAAVVAILREGSASDKPHIAATPTATHCRHVLEKGGETASLHVLGLLKGCLANLPAQLIKTLCEAILKTMTLGNRIVRTTCLHTLYGAMSLVAGPQCLSSSLTARIISALYDHQPGLADWQLLQAWLTLMQAAHIKLARLDHHLCLAHLVRFFSTSVSCLLSHNPGLTQTAASGMQALLTDVVEPYCVVTLDTSSKTQLQQIRELYITVVKGLDFKYRQSWAEVLKTLTVFHSVAGNKCHSVMAELLPNVCSLHSLPAFNLSAQLEEAVGAAIATMGPQAVLAHVPLDIDSEDIYPPALPRSWLLPVLRDHVTQSSLAYFRDHLLPLAGRLRSRADKYQEIGQKTAAALYTTLCHQVWSLLPAFCREPRDVEASFPGLARILGTALSTQPDLRITIATSLRQLVVSSREKEEEREVVSRFAKNYLPILFNLYTSEEEKEREGERQALVQCVEAYISISDQSLVSSLTSSALDKLEHSDLSLEKKQRVLDLVAAMATALPLQPLQDMLDKILPLLDSVYPRLQKKAYKVLERVLTCESHTHKMFVQQQLEKLMLLLIDSLSTTSTASKKPRLQCLLALVDHITPDSQHFLTSLTPEVILCTKETNEKCRIAAYQLLVRLGHASQRCYGLNPEESVSRYLGVVIAGLAGSRHMVSATIISLSRLLFEFHDVVSSSLMSRLLATMLTLLSSHTREVVKAAFGFIKIMIRVLPADDLAPHLEKLIAGVLHWSGDPKSHFRLKARVIMERLCRKFGFDLVCQLTPARHHRLLAHVRKSTERQKRKKSGKSEAFITDSEGEEEEVGGSGGKTRAGVWIRESVSGGDPIDFLDSSLAGEISSMGPLQVRSQAVPDFPTSADGRLLISEQSTVEKVENTEGEDKKGAADMKLQQGEQRRKRKREVADEGVEVGDVRGGGIHRSNPVRMDFDYGSEYRAKRAKGDVKVKGRPDPYAYVPLLGQKLNHRKRSKFTAQFQGLLKKAKAGAAAGSRARSRHKHQ